MPSRLGIERGCTFVSGVGATLHTSDIAESIESRYPKNYVKLASEESSSRTPLAKTMRGHILQEGGSVLRGCWPLVIG